MILKQRTIRRPVELSGVGLHTGNETRIVLKPAVADTGILFRRIDLPGHPEIQADVSAVTDTHRGTTLTNEQGDSIRTVEHLLAALTGLGIWNCYVEVDAEEIPAGDGSSLLFVDAIRKVGSGELDQPMPDLKIDRSVSFTCQSSGSVYDASPADELAVRVAIEFPHLSDVPDDEIEVGALPESFVEQVASARTFCHSSELAYLMEHDLARGGSLQNALVIYDGMEPWENVCRRLDLNPSERRRPEPGEPVSGSSFRLSHEPARHKLLDVLGDLALVGRPILGHITAVRPGHTGNTQFARFLRNHFSDGTLGFNTPSR